ncbi:MAG: amidohydrolase family protein [Patescibacteria group bacterium]|jgi:cytosine/adenosine deaminase-related metal-dependent hydrolase
MNHQPYDLKAILLEKIQAKGGFVNCHAHFDKAYVISEATLNQTLADMETKWDLWAKIKASYTLEKLKERMRISADSMVQQGVKYCRTNIDVDSTVGLMCIEAALAIKEEYKDKLTIQICSQVLEGALNPEAQVWIEKAAPMVDVLGGLPSRERPRQGEHLDYIFKIAKKYNKTVDVHIDQNNDPDEKDTELLAKKVIEHGLEGKVNAVHACSLASQSDKYMNEVIKLIKEAGMSVIVCPRSMLDQVDLRDKLAPVHNKIAPVPQLVAAGINVCLGTDNVHDYFCPFTTGSMWEELNFLLETCRYYDIEQLVNITTINGLKALGINK